jgi:UDP-N-acetyl-D-glucosamine dehydrogenase
MAQPLYRAEKHSPHPEALDMHDAVLLATNHDAFDDVLIQRHAELIMDTRGVYLEPAANVVKG